MVSHTDYKQLALILVGQRIGHPAVAVASIKSIVGNTLDFKITAGQSQSTLKTALKGTGTRQTQYHYT